jgi:hypothetical protein
MTKRRKRTLWALAVVAFLGALALPGVHWRLTGWVKGEPFYQGRPATYWRDAVARCEVYEVCITGDIVFPVDEPRGPKMHFGRKPNVMERSAQFLENVRDGWWGWYDFDVPPFPHNPGAEAIPVLTVLLADPEPKVRYFAADLLWRYKREELGPAFPALRRLRSDGAPVSATQSVKDAVRRSLRTIDPDDLKDADRP